MQNGKDIEQTLGDDNKNLHKIQKYKTISNISIVGLFVFFFQISSTFSIKLTFFKTQLNTSPSPIKCLMLVLVNIN